MNTGVDHKESCVKVTECVSPQEGIIRKVLLKIYGMRMTTRVDHKESCFKVTECVSPQEGIIRKVLSKLRNAYHQRSGS